MFVVLLLFCLGQAPFSESNKFKNTMLRLCNSIKRKLSKSLHTVFSGRILMFLAAVTPLTDKSGACSCRRAQRAYVPPPVYFISLGQGA